MPDARDLELIIASKTPLVVVESHEEQRVMDLLTRVAIKQGQTLFQWTITDGLQRAGGFGFELEREEPLADPEAVLRHIRSQRTPAVYALCDYHPFLSGSPERVRLIKDIALRYSQLGHTLVFISHAIELPPEIRRYAARFKLRMPDAEEILAIVREEAAKWTQRHGNKVKADNRSLNALVRNLQGLSWSDARRLARAAIFDDGAITACDLPNVNKAKFDLLDLEGAVSFELDTARFSDIGGLDRLKQWLVQRREAFIDGQRPKGLEPPRGILLLGVQGAGKSLAAKAVAGLWDLPLIRLDMGALYNKYIGETEKNLREALQMAELMSPCVLWMDEIEKGLAVSD
ncbi:MAG: AAA family ATPase, partial [Gammaproteobacteria bacterium]